MAGLVPAIHVLILRHEGVDARNKSGHDDVVFGSNFKRRFRFQIENSGNPFRFK
jgi:hypothetical protein